MSDELDKTQGRLRKAQTRMSDELNKTQGRLRKAQTRMSDEPDKTQGRLRKAQTRMSDEPDKTQGRLRKAQMRMSDLVLIKSNGTGYSKLKVDASLGKTYVIPASSIKFNKFAQQIHGKNTFGSVANVLGSQFVGRIRFSF